MIMCEWRQLVNLAIITANKPTLLHLPIFAAYQRSFDNKAQKANFSAKEQHQKLHLVW